MRATSCPVAACHTHAVSSQLPVARLFTELKDRGHYYTGLCPLHPESHHSFAVYPNPGEAGRWVCFHEYKGGDAVGLYAEVKGISYKEALKELRKMGLVEER